MPVKNTPARKIQSKKAPVKEVEKNDELDEEEDVATPSKIKMPIDLTEETDSVPLIDEKSEEDPLISDQMNDEMTDDSGIEDEIDPFGDKWEA